MTEYIHPSRVVQLKIMKFHLDRKDRRNVDHEIQRTSHLSTKPAFRPTTSLEDASRKKKCGESRYQNLILKKGGDQLPNIRVTQKAMKNEAVTRSIEPKIRKGSLDSLENEQELFNEKMKDYGLLNVAGPQIYYSTESAFGCMDIMATQPKRNRTAGNVGRRRLLKS